MMIRMFAGATGLVGAVWVTLTLFPATVSVADRATVVVFAATV